MASLRKTLYSKTLDIEDLSYLSRLLQNGLSLNECISLLKTRRNESVYDQIRKRLDQGELIEKVIKDYLPKKILSYVVSLLGSLSFQDALSLSLRFYEKNEEGKKTMLSQIAYPLILLYISMTALYLFDLYGIDSIFSLIADFEQDIGFYDDLRILFRVVVNLFYFGILALFLLLAVFTRPQKIVLLYIFLSKHFPDSFANIFFSEEFMSLLLVCMKQGYSTRESMRILKSMRNRPIVSFLAFHMDERLMEGETLKGAAEKRYFDPSVSRFIKIAGYTGDFSSIIDSYIFLARQKIAKRMKNATLAIQLITYLFIGTVIIFIYQILFMPMRAIATF